MSCVMMCSCLGSSSTSNQPGLFVRMSLLIVVLTDSLLEQSQSESWMQVVLSSPIGEISLCLWCKTPSHHHFCAVAKLMAEIF